MDLKALPKEVQHFYHSLEHVERPIDVERLESGGWRLISASDRVRVTIDLAPNRLGKTRWVGSTLTVDGKDRPLAANPVHLKAIFDNPDGTRDLGPLPDRLEPHQVPPGVRREHEEFAEALDGKADLVLGNDGKKWIIGFDGEGEQGSVQVRISYTPCRERHQIPGHRREIEVVVDGVDRTHEIGNDLAKLAALMAPSTRNTAPATPAGKTAGSSRSNAVETRRSTVIRV